jgi:hypothetical protein
MVVDGSLNGLSTLEYDLQVHPKKTMNKFCWRESSSGSIKTVTLKHILVEHFQIKKLG